MNTKKIISKKAHWQTIENRTLMDGAFPRDAFDFIGIHKNGKHWRLTSPMLLANPKTGTRPLFETFTFPNFKQAAFRALKIAEKNNLFVVNCER